MDPEIKALMTFVTVGIIAIAAIAVAGIISLVIATGGTSC